MSTRSRIAHRIALVLSAMVALAVAWWVGARVLEPVLPPPVPVTKTSVSFDPRVDVRTHPFFNTLQALYRGKVEAGMLGRQNPFLSATGALDEQLQEGATALGTIAEVDLGGVAIIDLSKGAENGVIALVSAAQSRSYTVQHMVMDRAPEVVGNWSLAADGNALAPVAAQEDRTGKIWLFSAGGHTGLIQGDGRPLWSSLPLAGARQDATAAESSFALDGAGRLWLTDGVSIFVGNGNGYERVDLSAQLSAANRQALGVAAEGELPLDLRRPRRLQMLSDGRMSVLTDRFVAIFSLNLQGGAEVIVASDNSKVITVEPLTGAVWSVVRSNGGTVTQWVRTVKDGSRAFTDLAVLPKQAAATPALAIADTGVLYALDYAPGATVLWSIRDGSWVASVLAAEGVQPQDQVVEIVPDRNGGVWAVLAQRGLLLARPSK